MNKMKARCSVCGKSFKTPSLKKTVCPNCDADAKRARHQSPAPAPVVQAAVATPTVDVRAALRAAQENQGQFGAYRPAPPPVPAQTPPTGTGAGAGTAQSAATAVAARNGAAPPRGAKPGQRAPKPPRPEGGDPRPRVARERKPRVQTKPFVASEEQVAAIRARYLELAKPEFDGIRHQVATDLGIPLRAVKDVVKTVRGEEAIASWWDNGGSPPTPEQIEQVRVLYLPQLPAPAVGIHKEIAATLHISNTCVYQAIGQIRSELELPRYTPRGEEQAGQDAGAEESGEAGEGSDRTQPEEAAVPQPLGAE